MKFVVRMLLVFGLVCGLVCGVVGCRKGLTRPYGYLRLGAIADLKRPETFLENERMVVRFDEGGFSAMSTLCTSDLSPLVLEGDMFVSRYSASTYSKDGRVATGPARENLPYYDLVIEASKPGGEKDTLFVEIGDERSPDWRLPAP